MTTFSRSRRVMGAVAVLGATALLITGCTRAGTTGGGGSGGGGSASSPGITDTTLSLGISSPLSGATAGPGTCSAAGLYSYLEAKNADGGFTFGDGKTRKVNLTYLDDAYDPAKAVANYRQLINKGMFAYVGALGTPTNAAVEPIANQQKVPQVLLIAGASLFSDRSKNPWTLGFTPTYVDEGAAYGKLLADAGKPLTVATLSQNDDYGKGYLEGFQKAIDGTDVKVVGSATYEPTDTSLDAQVTKLASTKADVLLSAVSVTPLQVGVLTKAQSLGWKPRIFLPSNTSTPATILEPGNAKSYPAVYTSSFSKVPMSPAFANDADVKAYNAAFEKYGSKITKTYAPHCVWSWTEGAILEKAFGAMKQPTRAAFMKALTSISGFEAPMMLPGITIDTTDPMKPAVSSVSLVKYNGEAYSPVDKY